ncbi:hypothetical protein ABZ949_05315 [Micromonospora tulbaghiae]|uniref:hypothetical protein n=1 Tax=Micromonospora tulbaghiae TaxID=479978 RepID=UPI0033FD5B1B
MTARRRRPARSRVRPHAFLPDRWVPADWRGRQFCRRCGLPGRAGDERHPLPEFPDTPPEAAAIELRRLGEHDEER